MTVVLYIMIMCATWYLTMTLGIPRSSGHSLKVKGVTVLEFLLSWRMAYFKVTVVLRPTCLTNNSFQSLQTKTVHPFPTCVHHVILRCLILPSTQKGLESCWPKLNLTLQPVQITYLQICLKKELRNWHHLYLCCSKPLWTKARSLPRGKLRTSHLFLRKATDISLGIIAPSLLHQSFAR